MCIVGDNPSSKTIAGRLGRHFDVVEDPSTADYVLRVEISSTGQDVVFDSIDCPFEECLIHHVRDMAPCSVRIDTHGGVQSDRACRIVMPADVEARHLAEQGVHRGFLEFMRGGKMQSVEEVAAVAPVTITHPSSGESLTAEQAASLLEQACTKMAALFTGAAQSSYREQARNDYAAISGQTQSEVRVAIAEMRVDVTAQISSGLHLIREDVRPKPIEGNYNAGLWTRIVAAIAGRVVVLEARK